MPVRIKHIHIQISGPGKNDIKIDKIIAQFPLKKGDIFNAANYNTAKENLFEAAHDEGYIRATFSENKILINTKTLSAVIILHLNTKDRYYFGKVTFDKNEYDPNFMKRFNIFHENEPFSSKKLIKYQEDMNSSRYFKQVLVIPDLQHPVDYHIPVNVSAIPEGGRRYTLGLGYGTFTGPRLTAGANFRRLTDTGQSFDAQIRLSSVLSGIAGKYYIPGKNPLTDQWVLGANYQDFQPANGRSTSKSLSAGYMKKIQHWQLTTNLNYLRERYTVFTTPARNSELLYPSFNATYVKADNLISPKFAKSLSVTLQGTSEYFLSSTSFAQGEIKGKYFFTPISFAHIILRGDLGYTVVQRLHDLPLSMRFFAGGFTSVRGYADSSIGPGRYLKVASIEYRNHITSNWDGAVFYDLGVASNQFNSPLKRGAGVGVIYESVIGPIRLYIARALSKPGQPHQVEFSLGPEF